MQRKIRVGLFLMIVFLSACSTMPGEPQITAPTLSALNESITAPDQPLPSETVLESDLGVDPATQSQESDSLITVWHSYIDEQAQVLYEAVAVYQKKQSVKVKLVYLPFDDLLESYRFAVNSGVGPDLLIASGDWGYDLFDNGLVTDLSGYLSDELISRMNLGSLGIVMHNDAVIGIPFALRGVVMYRNTSILPIAPIDFDELISFARNATQGRYIGAYLDRGDVFGAAQLSACGGTWMDERGYPNFNNEAGLCWIELLRAFEDVGPVTFDSEDDFDRFSAGNVGLIIDGTWKLDELVDALGEDLAIDPWPSYGGGHLSGFVWADCIYMNSGISKPNQVAAWGLIDFLSGQQIQTTLPEFGLIPAAVNLPVTDSLLQQAMQALSHGTPYPLRPEIEFYWEPLNTAINSVFEENVDPAVALQTARDQIVVEIAKNR